MTCEGKLLSYCSVDTMAMCEINVDTERMGDIDKEGDWLAIELSRNTMTGQWKEVVKMYKKHKIKAFSAKINTSGDTALHVAVSIAPDKEAQQLVRVIKDWYDEEVQKINDRYATEFQKIEEWYVEEVEKIKDKAEYEESLKYLQKKRNDDNNVYDGKTEKEITDILESAVWIKNNEGDTPLHVAASAQRISICILLIRSIFNSFQSLGMHNNRGESPLFLAAFHGHKNIFLCLHVFFLLGNSNTDFKSIDPAYLRCFDGETILHCAIRWEYFDLAFEILNVEPGLACSVSGQGITPLHLLASKPAVFKIGFRPEWWKKIIYHCIYVEELKSQTNLRKLIDSVTKEENNQNFRKSYQACICFYRKLKTKAQVVIKTIKEHCKGRNEDAEDPSKSSTTGQSENKGLLMTIPKKISWSYHARTQVQTEAHEHPSFGRSCVNIPYLVYRTLKQVVHSLGHYGQNADEENPNESSVTGQSEIEGYQDSSEAQPLQGFIRRYAINILYLFYKILSWVILRLGYEDLKKIKEKHVHSVQIMKLLVKHANDAKFDISSWVGPKQITEPPVLLAAGNGITKMVEQILEAFPVAINDRSKGKNIVHWAVKNRQPRVLQLLLKHDFVKRKLIHEVDTEKNNALHLAAEIGEKKPWLIPGAALQMQWEIKWYQFVKNSLPQHFCHQLNERGKTPEEIFNETHTDLFREGGEWLKSISNSCSVVATLIATVVFPAATTVPGGINDRSGMPILVEHPAFTLFAIASLVALFFSIMALFLFLTILTSRYQQQDFRSHVPRKLLLGLTLLFVSIGSMLISFCAGQFFWLEGKLKDTAFPVYTMICLPIILLSIAQFPLYFQILKATFKVLPPSYGAVSL